MFEHVEPQFISDLHVESHRLLIKNEMVLHNIDLSDHFSHSDSSIHPLRFLRYSDAAWNFFTKGTFFYQNRLRVNTHIELIENAGFDIKEIYPVYCERPKEFSVHPDIKFGNDHNSILTTQVIILAVKK